MQNVDYIEFKKLFNLKRKQAYNNSKLDYCLCCKNKVTSFCKSHSLPKFVLKNIAKKGMVLTSNQYFKIPLINESVGVKDGGTFFRICHKCDNEMFKDYESIDKISKKPNKKIMTQIDLKNTLKMYDKRLTEIEIYNFMLEEKLSKEQYLNVLEIQKINMLDLSEIKNEFDEDIKILKKESTSGFELIFWKKLQYITPIAFQGHIALYGDLKGNIINDIYNKSSNYIIENINICIFPLETETIVMMFISKENKKYYEFIKQFKQLSDQNKLNLIAFIIINYSEDFFISQDASKKILNNVILEMSVKNTTNIIALDEKMLKEIKEIKRHELMNYKSIPNLLDERHSLNK